MSTQALGGVLSEEQKKQFDEEGYLIVKGLLADDAQIIMDEFMRLHAAGPIPGCFQPMTAEEADGDILKQYPRMMHPHKVNEIAFRYMLHPKVMNILADLFGADPLAAQSMFYFKPPGAKGQALHQDQFYLKVEPGTCIAAWTAVDPADEENGGLFLVPQTNRIDIECPHTADPAVSFTKEEVDVPEGREAIPARMDAGDVLFFNGSVIHGSYPNSSADRFRRAFICHYSDAATTKIGKYYKPLYRHDGTAVTVEANEDAGPCGTEFQQTGAH
ncbi:phytanoyl-CoA dioxygenase family protein [Paenibacillus doosanensis]|uniref:phytanoyl-CoA dioxygenase family protein n=1 Tax=Paenibacillus doosanensis TaxID=1229154 RepID=UPI00217F84AD|nr:phytanoyl-CoA dioxygenase family protein [Paenibacillus doosanensis]MCS7458793.1 phytanoyl-CoA dioxygenase family protein [Paenibacillus doosanensis]